MESHRGITCKGDLTNKGAVVNPIQKIVLLQPLTGYEQTCKPSSVFDSHLSRPHISIRLKPRHGIKYAGPARVKTTPSVSVLHQVGFTWPDGLPPAGELLPRLSILACNEKLRQRFLSVALSLESPPPGVTRHPALWSSDFPHSCSSARPRLSGLLIKISIPYSR